MFPKERTVDHHCICPTWRLVIVPFGFLSTGLPFRSVCVLHNDISYFLLALLCMDQVTRPSPVLHEDISCFPSGFLSTDLSTWITATFLHYDISYFLSAFLGRDQVIRPWPVCPPWRHLMFPISFSKYRPVHHTWTVTFLHNDMSYLPLDFLIKGQSMRTPTALHNDISFFFNFPWYRPIHQTLTCPAWRQLIFPISFSKYRSVHPNCNFLS